MRTTSVGYETARCVCRVMAALMFDLRVYGATTVPRSGGVLLVSNHQSYLDPVLVAMRLPRRLRYLAKAQLFAVPGFSRLIRVLGAVPLRRGAGDVGAVRLAIDLLRQGELLTVFPEGTRTRTGEIAPVKAGVAIIIRRAAAPVSPVVVDGAFAAWPRTAWLCRPHPVRVLFGAPLRLEGLDDEQIAARIELALRELLAALREATHGDATPLRIRVPAATQVEPLFASLSSNHQPAV
jgi:1-acyl-sn-glycerol-3-phosphate acyltransferase